MCLCAFAHLGIAEEGVENLPHQDDGAEQQVSHTDPQYAGRQPVGQLLPVASPLVLSLQAPLVPKQRSWGESHERDVSMMSVVITQAISCDENPNGLQYRHHPLGNLK